MPVLNDEPDVWCVEEREIARLKGHGRGAPKKLRRKYGHCIRHWQRKLRRGERSVSIGLSLDTFKRVVLRKFGRPMTITYELPPKASFRGGFRSWPV
jgi:hypothetical protein